MRGRISRQFVKHLRLPSKKLQAWPGKVIRELMDWTQSTWRHRCAILHERNGDALPAHISRQVTTAYQLQRSHRVDRTHFRMPLEKRLKCSIDNALLWLENVRMSGRKHERDCRNANSLHAYFEHATDTFNARLREALDGPAHDPPEPPPPVPPDPDPAPTRNLLQTQIPNFYSAQPAP